MTSQARLTAARLALATAARGIVAGNLSVPLTDADKTVDKAALAPLAKATNILLAVRELIVLERELLRGALALVRKSRLARQLNGRGDLWNGDDRAHQFALLNEAARARRAVVGSSVGSTFTV